MERMLISSVLRSNLNSGNSLSALIETVPFFETGSHLVVEEGNRLFQKNKYKKIKSLVDGTFQEIQENQAA